MKKLAAALALCIPTLANPNLAFADNRPDYHAPISVMGDHKHHQGEFIFSYRFMHMSIRLNSLSPCKLGQALMIFYSAFPIPG